MNLFIFGTAEGAITIMAASIPILRALFQREARPRPAQPHESGEEQLSVSSPLDEKNPDSMRQHAGADTEGGTLER